jgi:hypothetical protein
MQNLPQTKNKRCKNSVECDQYYSIPTISSKMQGTKPSFFFNFHPSSWKALKRKTQNQATFNHTNMKIILMALWYFAMEGESVKDTEAMKCNN